MAKRATKCGLRSLAVMVAVGAATAVGFVPSALAAEGDIIVLCPTLPVEADSSIAVEIAIDTGSRVLGTYSANLLYDPALVVIESVAGGNANEFSDVPTTSPGSFASGTTPIAAANESSTTSPSGFVSVARVTLVVRAAPGSGFSFIVSPTGAIDANGVAIDLVSGACPVAVAGPTATPSPTVTATVTLTPTRQPVLCVGDCSRDGAVTVDEILTGVAIALGSRVPSECESFDENGDGQVDVTEIVAAVNASLVGCPIIVPTATPSPSATSSPTATPTTVPNLPPLLPAPMVYSTYPGQPIAYFIDADDPEGEPISYVANVLPDGAQFDGESGVLAWTPSATQFGPHYIPFTASDGLNSVAGLARLQVHPPNPCVDLACNPETGCIATPLAVGLTCCVPDEEPPRVAYVDAGCPEGGVVFAGRNTVAGIGRLEDCDWLRVLNFAQTGAAVRLNFETRCLEPQGGIRLRVRLQAPSRVVIDEDIRLTFFTGDNGYLERVIVPFTVLGGGPFFDLEFAEALLSVIASDSFGNVVRTDKRVRLTFDLLPDLEDPVELAP